MGILERYCSYKVSKLLKEKKFKEKVRALWIGDTDPYFSANNIKCDDYNSGGTDLCSAPTHQMAMDWLREVHKVVIVIDAYHADHWEGYIDGFEISIYSHASTIIVPNEIAHHTDYTEAVEAALKYSLENLI